MVDSHKTIASRTLGAPSAGGWLAWLPDRSQMGGFTKEPFNNMHLCPRSSLPKGFHYRASGGMWQSLW